MSEIFTIKNALSALSIVAVGVSTGLGYNNQGPLTMHEVQKSLGLDPLSAPQCKDNPNTANDERASQDCLDVWNACNGNPQKPVQERTVGCFDRNTIVYDASGRIVSFTPELTGYESSVRSDGTVVYTPISR